jgi:hypothetical protein
MTAGAAGFTAPAIAASSMAVSIPPHEALQAEPWPTLTPVRVRMALHTGEAELREGDYYGRAVNRCARVRAMAHGGQVLLTAVTRELVQDSLPPGVSLQDLGEHRLRDLGRSERIYLLAASDLPQEFAQSLVPDHPHVSLPPPAALPQPPEPPSSMDGDERLVSILTELRGDPTKGAGRIALLYKRNAQPDEQLLKLLEEQLTQHGYQVFIDRHMAIGVEWAKEIERQVCTAAAVIPLLSAAAIDSEMLHYELEMADKAAQQQGGKPRLLPVRVNYAGPLPDPIEAILGSLHYALWEGPQDDNRLLQELLHALQASPKPRPPVPPGKLEPVGGAVALTSQFYVIRPTDEQFQSAIARHDSIVLVKGARQMGKTSLLARGLQQAREAGARVIRTDFQMLDEADLESVDRFFRALGEWIADQLDLDVLPDQVWREHLGASVNFSRYLRREVLGKSPAPIVWGLDEVDRLFACDFGSQVFGLFRSLHNERQLDPTGPWSRLTLAMAYATEAHLFIRDVNQSPFNVGTRLSLQDFTLDQVADLNSRYGEPLANEAELNRYWHLVGGHPYLVHRGLYEMVAQSVSIGEFEAHASSEEGFFSDHLRRILVLLVKDPELSEALRAVLRGEPCPTPESFYRLRSAGVLKGSSVQEAQPRCQLYALYLKQYLR